jgi:FAD binding domain-containing protein/berberine-like enzyme
MLNSARTVRDVQTLRPRLSGEVVGPMDAGYDQARQAWNLAADQRPGLVVFPESADDVVAVVQHARRYGLQVVPQGTGHNASPIVWHDDMILLSTSRMRGVEIDVEGQRARVAAGTEWLEVTELASPHKLAPLAGSSPNVGVVGYSLGGGISWLGRKHGLSANSVLAIEIVTADGRLRRVDADNDADLFWALRGGGGNFGVVTAMEIALYPMADLYAGAMWWDWERSAEVMHAWREWTATVPDEVTSSARIMQMPPIPEVPEFLRGRNFVTIDAAIIGDRAFGAELVQALRDLDPEIDTFDVIEPVALSRLHNDPEDPIPGLTEHRLLGDLPAEAVDAFLAVAGPGSGSPLLLAEIRHLGGALGVAKPGHGALAKVDAGYLLFAAGIAVPPLLPALQAHLPVYKAALAPWDAGTSYLNFEETEADSRSFYDELTYRRLARIKTQYDPSDVFRANHPIKGSD